MTLPAIQHLTSKLNALRNSLSNLYTAQTAQAATIAAQAATIATVQAEVAEAQSLSTCVKTADQTLIGSAFTDVSELSFALVANTTYKFRFDILADADATTTGIDVAVNGPAGTTVLNYLQTRWTSATVTAIAAATAYDNDTASTDSSGAAVRAYIVEGIIRTGGTAGTLSARIKREAVGTGPNVRVGSCGFLWRLTN